MLKGFLNNYFGFNKQQRNGLLVLVLISFSLLLVRFIYPYFIKPDPIIISDLPLVEIKLDSAFEGSKKSYKKNYPEKKKEKEREKEITFFVFDPNTVTYEKLLLLGFREKTAAIFIKFRSKGFVFKQKKDLKKVYGISDQFFSQLEPYILVENKKIEEPSFTKHTDIAEKRVKAALQPKSIIELNAADSLALIGINGIGPGYAKRILKYRNLLGGYYSVEQLKEVYGFTEELFEKVQAFFSVNSKNLKKINLNKDDFKTINKHPYLSYELTKTIFDWRRKTNLNATNLQEIINDKGLYLKLLPYLTFE